MLTAAQVADRLGVCVETVWRMVRRKELEATKIGRTVRISPEQLARYIERNSG